MRKKAFILAFLLMVASVLLPAPAEAATFDVNFDNGTYVETTDLQALGEQLSQQGGSYGENTDEDYPEPQE